MSAGRYRRAIRAINLRIDACVEARRKLRERRSAPRANLLLIELELVRLKFTQGDLEDWKNAFKLDQKSLPAPSADAIQELRDKVETIAEMNAANRSARAIVQAAAAVIGRLRRVSMV